MASTPLYKDPTAPVEKRVEDLLSRMTLEEKGQQLNMMNNSWGAAEAFLKDGKFSEEAITKTVGDLGQGSVHQREDDNTVASYVESTNAVQKYMLEKTRLGIPTMFVAETLHGFIGSPGTIFPQALGLGCTWNVDLIGKIGTVIGIESRSTGSHIGLSPVLDVAREPRWGRMEETYGEDPYLVTRLGVAMIKGMQGEGPTYKRIVATPKHFAGHGAPQAGRDSAPVGYGREFLREFVLPPFEAAIREAKAGCIMAAYSDWCYTPCSASYELLTEILRDEWGFEGFVIEDMGAVMLLKESHTVAENWTEAGRMAVEAGVDQSFASGLGGPAVEMVKQGRMPEETLNKAVRRVLRAKFLLGLFEDPYVSVEEAQKVCDSAEHRALARRAAQESIVMLKNDDSLLPLSKSIKTIAVIGPNADMAECGDYTGRTSVKVTPLQGIKNKVGDKAKVLYAEGCKVLSALSDKPTLVQSKFLTPKGTTRGIAPQPGSTGLMGEYFEGLDLSGEPKATQVDTIINGWDPFWSPVPGSLPVNNFSVRWAGVVVAEVSDDYEFSIGAAGGYRLYLDDKCVIDAWDKEEAASLSHVQTLKADLPCNIVIEYRSKTNAPGIKLLWNNTGKAHGKGIADAVAAAKQADVAVVVVGGSGATSGEIRDMGDLDLTGEQMDLIKAVYETKTPVVLVHIGGRPNTMEWAFDHIPAALAAWDPGEEGGNAIADILFGDATPSGKLNVQWPRAAHQLPSTYDYMHTGRNERGGYVTSTADPRFPFGHGLSYTKFEYSNLKVDAKVKNGQNVNVTVDVRNTGKCDGTEVAQLYVRDLFASVKRPMRQLKGFERVELKKGETKTVKFVLTPAHLALWNAKMQHVVEPGDFKVMVGGSSATVLEAQFAVE